MSVREVEQMTVERAKEIKDVFYKHLENIMRDLEECEDTHVIFNVGRHMGMMQDALNEELEKEVKTPGFGSVEIIDA